MGNTIHKSETTIDQSLSESELRYRRLFEAAQDGILILDANTGAISDVNPFLMNMLGYTREEFVSKKLWEVGAFRDIEASQKAFEALQEIEYIRYEDLPLKAKDGRLVPVEFVSNVYLVGPEKVIQCNIRDITERKQAQDALLKSEAQLRELAVRDYLTGLFNRRYMEVTLERELLRALRNQQSLGVIMLDVDEFKRFNDTYGHAAGDDILRELGHILLLTFRKDDIPSRYGGDEFTIILPGASLEVLQVRADLIREHARHIFLEGMMQEGITLSIGISIFPENGFTSPDILKAADDALYCAKNQGRDRVVLANCGSESS